MYVYVVFGGAFVSVEHVASDFIVCGLGGVGLSVLLPDWPICVLGRFVLFVLDCVLRVLFLPYYSIYYKVPGPHFVMGLICT